MPITVPVAGIFLSAIAVSAALVYLPFLAVGVARVQVGYDMAAPRAMFDKLPPYAQRATWAHQNAFEAFTLFAPAALMAYATGLESTVAIGAAIAHVVARIFYAVFYIASVPPLRSACFAVGSLSTFTLFVLSCLQVLS